MKNAINCLLEAILKHSYAESLEDLFELPYEYFNYICAYSKEQIYNFEYSVLSLIPEEREIISYKFGFCDGKIHKISECAKKFNISSHKATYIVKKGTRKLRHPAMMELICKFLQENAPKIIGDQAKKRLLCQKSNLEKLIQQLDSHGSPEYLQKLPEIKETVSTLNMESINDCGPCHPSKLQQIACDELIKTVCQLNHLPNDSYL